MWIVIIVAVIICIIPVVVFEKVEIKTEKIVIIAILAALASAGRVIFGAIPSVQPSSFIVIMSGMVFGPYTGAVTGTVLAVASNMMLGQGPWTIWQMGSWALMGMSAGLTRKSLNKNLAVRIVFSLFWGFLFGAIMNVYMIVSGSYAGELNWGTVVSIYATSLTFDLAHALSNAVLMGLVGNWFIELLGRMKNKYGL